MTETPPPGPPAEGPAPAPPPAAPPNPPPATPPPPGYGAPPGYGPAPPGYGPPPGYGTPPGYGPPPGYGAPPGYGIPPGYPAPPGYGAPLGYPQPYGAVPTRAGPLPGLVYAGFWIRWLGLFLDGLILLIPRLIVLAAVSNVALANLLNIVVIPGGYLIGFWSSSGRTPGMAALSLRVVREEDGGPLDLGRATLRFLGFLLSSVVIGIGFIWAAFDARKQGWHDKIARTLVVKPG